MGCRSLLALIAYRGRDGKDAVEATLSAIIEALKPSRTFHGVVMDAKKMLAAVDSEAHFFGFVWIWH